MLSLAQLQEVLTILEVIIILGVVLVGNGFGLHVGRQVSAFAADTGNHHNSLIGEALGVRNQRIGILVGRNLRQGPILGPHSNNRTVRTVVGVQLAQIGVGFKTSFLHAIKQGNGVVLVRHGAGAGASIDRVGGAPTEHVDLLVTQRQVGIIVLQHGDSFRLHFLGQLISLGNSSVRQHVLGDRRVVQQGGQRAGQHHGDGHDDAHQGDNPGFRVNELARAHVLDRLLVDGKGDDDGQYQQHADNHQIGDQRANDVHDVGHVDLQHGVSPPCFLPNCGIRVRFIEFDQRLHDTALAPWSSHEICLLGSPSGCYADTSLMPMILGWQIRLARTRPHTYPVISSA